MNKLIPILLIIFFSFSCRSNPYTENLVVATNAWTAAYAMAAGATEVVLLAPYEMVHPSEYELRPGDIERLLKAKIIIYAGYEVMMDQIQTGLEIPAEKLVKVTTSYNADEIEKSVRMLAEKLGTVQIASENIKEIRQLLSEGRKVVQEQGYSEKPVLVHFFQESFATEMGITPVMIFGPAPPEPRQILDMTNTNAVLILDNAHNPVAGMMKETLKTSEYRLLLNFPGMYNTRTLSDVIRYNIEQVIQ